MVHEKRQEQWCGQSLVERHMPWPEERETQEKQ